MTEYPYMVIFPKVDRKILDVAYVVWYEEDDWALASKKRFASSEEAREYALVLSKEHNIPVAFHTTLDGT